MVGIRKYGARSHGVRWRWQKRRGKGHEKANKNEESAIGQLEGGGGDCKRVRSNRVIESARGHSGRER